MKKEKNYINKIILVSLIALIGLTSIQAYWMYSAVKQQKSQFNRSIHICLHNIIREINKAETLKKVNVNNSKKMLLQLINKKNINNHISIKDSLLNHVNKILDTSNTYLLDSSLINKRDKQNIPYPIRCFIKELLSIDYFLNVKDRIAKSELDDIVNASIKKYNIKTDVYYAVIDIDSSIIYSSFNEKQNIKELELSQFTAPLFPDGYFNADIKLSLLVPNQNITVLKSTWMLLLLSVIFLIIIISAFYYNLRTIYRQKKVSVIKNDFINNMTHEIKTPVSTISLACEALLDKDLSSSEEKRKQFVSTIYQENKRLGALVENVLRSASIEKEDLVLNKELLNLETIIQKAVKNINLQLNNKNGSIELELNAENKLIEADKTHITSIFFNLLDNAIKYSYNKPEIIIKTEDVISGVVIKIIDSGIGIDKEHHMKIFDKLYRVPTGDVHNVKGFGLGLSYVKSIVELHMGNVKVESNLQKGSTFILHLPAANKN